MLALIFDTETTGLTLHPTAKDSLQPRIIEWGGVLIDAGGKIIDELDVLINPGAPLSDEITKITGLTDDDLKDAPRFSDVVPRLRDMFCAASVMIAHNLPFDSTLIKLELKRAGLRDWPWPKRKICTVQEHAELFGFRPNLGKLYESYFNEPLAQKHRALDDVKALARIVVKMRILEEEKQ